MKPILTVRVLIDRAAYVEELIKRLDPIQGYGLSFFRTGGADSDPAVLERISRNSAFQAYQNFVSKIAEAKARDPRRLSQPLAGFYNFEKYNPEALKVFKRLLLLAAGKGAPVTIRSLSSVDRYAKSMFLVNSSFNSWQLTPYQFIAVGKPFPYTNVPAIHLSPNPKVWSQETAGVSGYVATLPTMKGSVENQKDYGRIRMRPFRLLDSSPIYKWYPNYLNDLPSESLIPRMENAATMVDAINSYPFPEPHPGYPLFRMAYLRFGATSQGMKEYLESDTVFTEEKARTVVTLTVMENFKDIATWVDNQLKDMAERKKRRGTILTIAMAAFALPVAIVAAPIVTAAVTAALKGISFAQQKKAADGLVAAAEHFQKTDAAFAEEMERVAAELAAGAPPEHAGAYVLVVEGKEIGSAPSVEEIAKLASDTVKPGDRFEIMLDGRSLGLKIMTASGPVSVPEGDVDQVVSKSPEEIRTAVKKAERGRFPWSLLLAVPVGYAVVKGSS